MDDDLEDDFEPLGEEDPLDAENFNAIDYINRQFPNEASLGGLGLFINQLKAQEHDIEEGIKNAVRRQAAFGRRAKADLGDAKLAIRELFERIKAIKSKAEQSEELVSDVCRDIKSLDVAKRNLTLTVTALKRLVMLVTALEQLRSTAECRHYQQASSLIYAVEELSSHFQELSHVARVADLLERKAAVFSDLKQQILDDYMCLHGGIGSATRLEQLPEGWGTAAAKCVDAIGPGMKREVVTQFCLRLLEGYKDIFQPPKEASGLETAERRFAWLKRTLREYDDKYKSQFPESWRVPCGLCDLFCHVTRQHLVEILDTTHHMVDPELMVRVLLKSIEFENELARKWATETPDDDPITLDAGHLNSAMPVLKYPDVLAAKTGRRSSTSSQTEAATEKAGADHFAPRFRGIISECFDAYLGTWVRHEEKQLLEVLQALTAADKMVSQENEENEEDEEVLQRYSYKSAPELFAAMRGSMQECSRFSTHNTLFDIFQVFRKVMSQLASKLSSLIPAAGHKACLDVEGVQAVCCAIGTAEYCDETLPLLEESLIKIISADFQDRIGFHDEQELLRSVVNRANEALVQSVNCSLDDAFNSMNRTNWAAFSQDVGDHSAFVGDISERLPKQFEPIAAHLSKIHYRFFCDKFVQSFVTRFVAEVHKCRKISERGAQQLLLDTALIKTTLLEAPVVAGHGRQMPTAYSNYVLREMGKAEIMLKVLSSPDVDAASITAMLGDSSDDPVVQQLLALRAGDSGDASSSGSMEQQFRHEADRIAAAAGVPSIGSTMNYLGDALNKGAKASEDLKKISGDMKKNFQKLGFPSFGMKKSGHAG